MLKLAEIRKSYKTFDYTQTALDGISVTFRDNEFAAVLGPSGSGKTTMLNIIGGLDHYDSGDLEIDGISTKEYKSSDWDTYRNNRIGFVFQSYNLIPHQSILSNVELALTLSGVSPSERKERAKEALEEVGLGDHIRKLPNQLSGGQMQRVAIARALINDPEILLADEPTGALDTSTSEQVMNLLKRIAKDRLVIMVTHNSELADEYATRIIQLKDGQIISDTNPLDASEEKQRAGRAPRKVSMSFLTAISLSLSNLMTKKGRTFVTALAGSIGIIGIAAILALASGIDSYIAGVEQETMSIYPLTIQGSGIDFSGFFADSGENAMGARSADGKSESGGIKEQKITETLFNHQNKNDLKSLKSYIETNGRKINPYVKNIQYSYNVTPQIYLADTSENVDQINPDSILGSYGLGANNALSAFMGSGSSMGMNVFNEMPGDIKMFEEQYVVDAGRWPESYDEAVIVLMPDGSVSDYVLYTLGLRNRTELEDVMDKFVNNPDAEVKLKKEKRSFNYEDLMSAKLKVISAADKYAYDKEHSIWVDKSDNSQYMSELVNKGLDLKIVGVVQADPDAKATSLSPGVNYTPKLTGYLMKEAADKEIIKKQIANPAVNVLTGKSFAEEKKGKATSKFDFADLFSIDENAIRNAFNMDPSQINLDLSGLGDISINTDEMEPPSFDISEVTESIAGEVNIPSDELTAIMTGVMQGFLAEEAEAGAVDPNQMAEDLAAYLARPDVQGTMTAQLNDLLAATQIDTKLAEILRTYMETTMQSYIAQMMDSVQAQLQVQLQDQIQNALSQLPAQMQNAISIDQNAFAQAFKLKMSEDEILEFLKALMNPEESTYESNLSVLGYADPGNPTQINIYPLDFNSKDDVKNFLENYNDQMEKEGEKDKVVRYTDLVGTLMTSVTDIVDTISYALIAFVAISLVVSSIMIGVITYISVLERKKEIGILRALGASKRDVRRVFNAETLIIGLVAGVLGVAATYLISIPANIIVYNKLGIERIAQLPVTAALILTGISMFLAFISGLFPSSAAARKDPVEALRSE